MAIYARQLRKPSTYGSGEILGSAFALKADEKEISFHQVNSGDLTAWLDGYQSHGWLRDGRIGVCFVTDEDLALEKIELLPDQKPVPDDPWHLDHYIIPKEKLNSDIQEYLAGCAANNARKGLFAPLTKKSGIVKEFMDPTT